MGLCFFSQVSVYYRGGRGENQGRWADDRRRMMDHEALSSIVHHLSSMARPAKTRFGIIGQEASNVARRKIVSHSGTADAPVYPFTALVGQEDLTRALLLNVVN